MKTFGYIIIVTAIAGTITWYFIKKKNSAPNIAPPQPKSPPPIIKTNSDIIYDQAVGSAKNKILGSSSFKSLQPLVQDYVQSLFVKLDKQGLINQATVSNTALDRLIMNQISKSYTSYAHAATQGRDSASQVQEDFFGINGFERLM